MKNIVYTDYPFEELGDTPGKKAPIRKVEVTSYDGDKYCTVKFENITKEIKSGYLYKVSGRCGDVQCIDTSNFKI
jgi:hypothetical protein